MAGKILEAKAVITGELRPANFFEQIEAKVARLNKAMGRLGKTSGEVARMGRYIGRDGGGGEGRVRAGVAAAEAARRRVMSGGAVEVAELQLLHAEKALAEARARQQALMAAGAAEAEALAHAERSAQHAELDLARARAAHRQAMAGTAKREVREAAEAKAYRREVMAGGAHMSGLGLGVGLAAGLAAHEVAKASADRVHERVRMQASGMAPGEIHDAEKESAKLAALLPALGETEIMHMLRNARSIVGSYKEAAEIMEPLAKLRIIAQAARPGADVSEDFDQLVKGLEIKGVTQDHHKFKSYMEGIAKGLNVFGDTLKPYQYYEMFKYGRQATPGLSEKFILGTAPTLAQELGGSSYGNAVSGFNRAIVGGRMEHSSIKELARIGLLGHDDVDWLKSGEAKGIKPGKAVHGWQLAQSDPNEWVKQYLLPALRDKGITDPSAIMKEIGTLFSNRMAAQLVSLLATQQSRIDKDLALLNHAKGLGAAEEYQSKDPKIAYQGLKNAIEGGAATIGSGIAAALTPSMNDLAKAIAGYTARIAAAQDARAHGEEPQGSKDLNRLVNRARFGVDSELDPSKVSETQKLDADYAAQRAKLAKRRGEKGGEGSVSNLDWQIMDWALAHPDKPYPGNRHALRAASRYPDREEAADKDIAALDAVHEARLKAARDLAEHQTNVKRAMRFASGPHSDMPFSPTIGPASETSFGVAAFPTARRMDYGGIDPSTGAPKHFGPFRPNTPPAVAQPSGPTDLAATLNGRIEAKVVPDQIQAKVEGQVEGSVSIHVEAGADLKATIAAAKGGANGNFKMNVGSGAPGTGPAGRTPSGK